MGLQHMISFLVKATEGGSQHSLGKTTTPHEEITRHAFGSEFRLYFFELRCEYCAGFQ